MMVFAHAADGWDGMWHMGDGGDWWMFFGMLMMVAPWIAIIWAVAFVVRRPLDRQTDEGARAEPTALDILEQRYARGEVSDEEFDAKRRTLSDARTGSA
jgi:putative membrane protein